MEEVPHSDYREKHESQGKLQDRHLVPQQILLRDAPAVEEEQRRQEKQKEDVRLQTYGTAGKERDHAAQRNLHERRRHGERQEASHRAADDDRYQHRQNDTDGVHPSIVCVAESQPGRAVTEGASRSRRVCVSIQSLNQSMPILAWTYIDAVP